MAEAGTGDAKTPADRQAHLVQLLGLIELVLSKPLVSTGIIKSEIGVTQRAALCLVEELAR